MKKNKIREIGLKESGRCAQRHRSQQELWRLPEGLRGPGRAPEAGAWRTREQWSRKGSLLEFLVWRVAHSWTVATTDSCPRFEKETHKRASSNRMSKHNESIYLHLELLPAHAVGFANKPSPQNTKPTGSSCLLAFPSVDVLLLPLSGLHCSFLRKLPRIPHSVLLLLTMG